MRIGITGSIACGKSTVAGYLRSLGYCVVDADAVSRELTAENGRAMPEIREVFPDCINSDGTLNRKLLGAKVFHDPTLKKRLECILHPMIFDEIDRLMDEADTDTLVFADIPLLFECGMESRFDEVWVVTLDPSLQMKRLIERDHLTVEEARTRIKSQMPQSEKAARATRCIRTDGTPDETRTEVDKILFSLLSPVPRRRRRHEPDKQEKETLSSHVQSIAPKRSGELPIRQTNSRKSIVRGMPASFRLLLFVLLLLTLIIGTFFSVKSYVNYRSEQRKIAAEAAERAQHPLFYGDLIVQYSAKQNLDPSLVSAVILNESSFNPKAVSRLGARGLMQLMEDTAGWIAHKLGEDTAEYSFDLLFDPEINIRFGTWYLGFLSRRYNGDARKIVCAYHAGQGNVDAWLRNPQYSEDGVTLTTIPTQDTMTYEGRVIKARDIYEKYYFGSSDIEKTDGADKTTGNQ